MKPSTHSSRVLFRIVQGEGIPTANVYLLDAEYVLLDDDKAAAYFRDLAFEVQTLLGTWTAESRDCDKYSRTLQSLALLTHAGQWAKVSKADPAALAIGVFNYIQDSTGTGHSINALITKKNGQDACRVRFFEPQSGEEMTLSDREIKNTTLLLL